MPFNAGVNNAGYMPAWSAGDLTQRPAAGLPFQMFLDAIYQRLYFDNGVGWVEIKANPLNLYTFGSGLSVFDYNVTNDLITGIDSGQQIIVAGNNGDDFTKPGHLYLTGNSQTNVNGKVMFYDGETQNVWGTFYQATGNWTIGGNIADQGVSFYSSGTIQASLLQTAILKLDWNALTPAQVANKTIFFADASGKLSWFNGNASYQRTFDATGITAARTWTLPDATTTLAGLGVANVFTAAQTFNAGITITGTSTFPSGASISSGGSITSGGNINMPSSGEFAMTGKFKIIQGPVNGSLIFTNGSSLAFTQLLFSTGSSTQIGIYNGTGSPETVVTARIGSLYLRTDGTAGATLYVKESGTGNTGWIGK